MKKLMIAAAIVCAAVASQAAAVQWKTGGTIKPDGSSTAANGTLNMYVWSVSESVYNSTKLEDIWKDYGSTKIADIKDFDASITGKGGTMSSTASQTVTAPAQGTSKTYYGIIIGTYDSNMDGTVDMYVVNKNTAVINDAGTTTGGSNLLKAIEGGSTAITWKTAAVPEPTSALLMLMGLAGLALKRKRA